MRAPGHPCDLSIIIVIFLKTIVASSKVRMRAIETPVPDHCNLPSQATEESHTLGDVRLSTGAAWCRCQNSRVERVLFSKRPCKKIVKKIAQTYCASLVHVVGFRSGKVVGPSPGNERPISA